MCAFAGCRASDAPVPPALQTGRLGDVRLIEPQGTPRGLVFLFSTAHGWSSSDDRVAAGLAYEGAIVVGVDFHVYRRALNASGGECLYLLSEIESLSQQVQRSQGLASYTSPILAGRGHAGMLVSAALAQTPFATAKGAVAVNPTEALRTRLPLCPGASFEKTPAGFVYAPVKTLPGTWSVGFTRDADRAGRARVEAAIAAGMPGDLTDGRTGESADELLVRLTAAQLETAEPAAAKIELPLVELPATRATDTLAIVLSGDGGWRDLDKTIAEWLHNNGVNVVGWDSLRYFWKKRTPDEIARDLDSVILRYSDLWHARNVVLVGYSFGADVLPFAYNRLSDKARSNVVQVSLLAFSHSTDFVVHLSAWLGAGASPDALPNGEETARIPSQLIQCFYGRDEEDTYCPELEKAGAEVIATAGGHHFDGNYDALAARILAGIDRRARP
jgi:type IV secretory pathway VirJ component